MIVMKTFKNKKDTVLYVIYANSQGYLKDSKTDNIMFTFDILDAKPFYDYDEAFKMKKNLHKFYKTVAIMQIMD